MKEYVQEYKTDPFRIIVVGNNGCGKACLINSFLGKPFSA